jgi:hypothetical protein
VVAVASRIDFGSRVEADFRESIGQPPGVAGRRAEGFLGLHGIVEGKSVYSSRIAPTDP